MGTESSGIIGADQPPDLSGAVEEAVERDDRNRAEMFDRDPEIHLGEEDWMVAARVPAERPGCRIQLC